jgi:hypothetical protein
LPNPLSWAGSADPARAELGLLKFALVLLIALSAIAVLAGAAWAQSPEVELEVAPASVGLAPDGSARVLVLVRNRAAVELRDVRLSWFSDADIDVAVEAPASPVVVPYSALTWVLRLSATEDGPAAGRVHLRIDYVWEREAGTGPAPGVVVGSLEVQPRHPQPAESVAEVGIETALTSLNRYRPGLIYLVVSNTAGVPIRVKKISPQGPGFVTFEGPELGEGATLAPGEARAFPYQVRVPGRVRPGKHLLLFDVDLEWEDAGRLWTRREIVTHEVEVGVFGESGILTAVGVPSLLILPGVLMLLTVKLLWRSDGSQGEFPLKVTSAEAGLIAVTLSLLTALVYPVVTGWAGTPRNYLEGYELWDVMWVWFGSVVVAAAGYLLVVGGTRLWTRAAAELEAWRKRRRTPSDGDPIAVLRMLNRLGLGLKLPRVDAEIQGQVRRGYVLVPLEEGEETIWIGPNIVVEWRAGAEDALQREVERHLTAEGSPAALADLLNQGRARGELKVAWKKVNGFDGPREVSAPDEGAYLEPTIIVEQE